MGKADKKQDKSNKICCMLGVNISATEEEAREGDGDCWEGLRGFISGGQGRPHCEGDQ